MKKHLKLFVGLFALLFTSASVFASGLEIGAGPTAHFYNDAKNAVGVGVSADVTDAFGVSNLRIGSALEQVNTEVNFSVGTPGSSFTSKTLFVTTTGKLADGRSGGSFDLDIKDWSFNAGYDFKINDKLTLTPGFGLDLFFTDASSEFSASNEVGAHIGGTAKYALGNGWVAKATSGYQWGSTDVELNANGGTVDGGSQHVDLGNFYTGLQVGKAW